MGVSLKVAARSSPLSKAQVKEVFGPLDIPFEPIFVTSHGDIDKKTSLRALDKTDFFTREVDALVLSGKADVAVHSAKDLPEEIPEGLKIAAITKGQDPSDSLVMREGESLSDVKVVATSSVNREHNVKQLKADVAFVDIRGTIGERLEKLYQGDVDGVVIAEAALIRLGLNPNRVTLPGSTTPLQGQLAIVARHKTFIPELEALDVRPKETLYLGLRCKNPLWHHFPIIEIEDLPFERADGATHYIFTSRTAAKKYRPFLENRPIFCVGKATAKELEGFEVKVAELEQAEGVVELLKTVDLEGAHVVWPRAEGARTVISDYLNEKCRLTEIPLYRVRTTTLLPPDPKDFKQIVFTSPSTVKAYQELFGKLPHDKELLSIGEITKEFILG
ncbi:MAG: uroporphyrinogen-III synthase [Chlamydiia bacterium]|nr:uroporphyrinogen-III synthase [Chlamydiia bacterium]